MCNCCLLVVCPLPLCVQIWQSSWGVILGIIPRTLEIGVSFTTDNLFHHPLFVFSRPPTDRVPKPVKVVIGRSSGRQKYKGINMFHCMSGSLSDEGAFADIA